MRDQSPIIQDATATRELLDYYKDLLIKQSGVVKALQDQIRDLQSTHRGGVLHPDFHKADKRETLPNMSAASPTSPRHEPLPFLPEAVIAARTLQTGGIATTTEHQAQAPPSTTLPPRRHHLSRRGLDPVQKAIDRNTSML